MRREIKAKLDKAIEDAEILRNIHNENTLVGIWPKEVVRDLQTQLKALEDSLDQLDKWCHGADEQITALQELVQSSPELMARFDAAWEMLSEQELI